MQKRIYIETTIPSSYYTLRTDEKSLIRQKMRKFGTQGPVNPEQHYVVARTEELAEFFKRVKEGRYIVIFTPRQTGKTTFFMLLWISSPPRNQITSLFTWILKRIKTSHLLIFTAISPPIPHSLGIVGVKSIEQLNADRSASPFNIHDDFALPNFTLEQVQELLGQYTDETGQPFASEVIESIHKQTGGHPFLVNRLAQILTEEMDIPKTEALTMTHFSQAHRLLLNERNTNLTHLTTNIRRNPRFENFLMRITLYEEGVPFNLRNELINELATYGVLTRGTDRMCKIANPIYLHCSLQAFKPVFNGLENDYFPEDTDGFQYLTDTGQIQMERLLNNFRDFIARVGFRILQVPETPQEFIGQHLLFAYLDQFITSINGTMYMEVPTGRGRMDLIIFHNQKKYVVETKIWRSDRYYTEGKQQPAAYLSTEDVTEGYYVVFDHRETPKPRTETETIDGLMIRSYVIPVVQERPSHPVE